MASKTISVKNVDEVKSRLFQLELKKNWIKENKNQHEIENDCNSLSSRIRFICSEIRQMKIEVVMFLYMFSFMMRYVTSTNMIVFKVCAVHLNFTDEICSNLTGHPEEKNIVVKLATNYQLGHSLIQMLPSSILAVFVGSWSDKYGRKAPIIAALVGIMIDGFGSTACAFFLHTRVEIYYIPVLFTGFSGGFIGVITVLYSYASDISTFNNRTMKFALLETAYGTAMPLGALVGGWMFKFYGYIPVFLTSAIGHVLGLLWVLFVIKETRGQDNTDSWKKKLLNLWSTQSVMESFRATIKPRPNSGRKQILLLILVMSLAVLTYASTPGINFLYVHYIYDWDNATFSTVFATFSVVGTLAMVIMVPIFKRLKFGDAMLGIVGSCSLMSKNIGIGLATSEFIYYLGKIFSFLTSAESLFPIMSQAIVSQIFNASLETFPGLVYVILGSLIVVPLGVFIWISRLPAPLTNEHEDITEQSKINKNVECSCEVTRV